MARILETLFFVLLLCLAVFLLVAALEKNSETSTTPGQHAEPEVPQQPQLDLPAANEGTAYLDLIAESGIFLPTQVPANEGLDFLRSGSFWKANSLGDGAAGASKDANADSIAVQAANLLATLSDEAIVGQLFILGWASQDAEGPVMDWIRERGLGGIKVFGWNGQNLRRLAQAIGTMQTAALEGDAGIPLFTATDQEGGWVRHIKDTTSVSSGNMALGADGLLADSYLAGYFIGTELRALGINMNFAPTVDVYRNSLAYVIGPRAFGSEVQATAELGTAFFRGQDLSRVISTAKHFPGHGNASEDSHGTLPVIEESLEELLQMDLVPFQVLIDRGIPAILTGHLNFPQITNNTLPASMSEFFKTDILRERLGFSGLTITDDLMMEGAWEGRESKPELVDIVLDAIRAGSDLIMLSSIPEDSEALWQAVLTAFREDQAFREAAKASAQRVLELKIRYLLPDNRVPLVPDSSRVYAAVPAPGAQSFFSEQAARSAVVVSGMRLPLSAAGSTLIVSQDPSFVRVAHRFFPAAGEFIFDYNPNFRADPQVISELLELAPQYDKIVFHMLNGNSSQVLSALGKASVALARKISVVSSLSPVYLSENTWVQNAIAVFGMTVDAYTAGLDVLLGNIPASGENPIPYFFAEDQ